MDYVTVDASEFPLVTIVFNLKDPTLQQFNQFIEVQKELLTRKRPFVLLMDARNMGFLSSEMRIAHGQFFKDYKQALKDYCYGAAVCVSSPMVSIMLKGIMLIESPPTDVTISSDYADTRKKAEAMVAERIRSRRSAS